MPGKILLNDDGMKLPSLIKITPFVPYTIFEEIIQPSNTAFMQNFENAFKKRIKTKYAKPTKTNNEKVNLT
jgi:hypothetical protein